jgi:tRNA A37 methylthiotransferase MiaB
LRQLAQAKERERKRRQLGRVLRVLVEREREPSGRLRGYSDGYVRVAFDGPDALRGRIVPVLVERFEGDELVGRPSVRSEQPSMADALVPSLVPRLLTQ